jgi:hypothetical protein
MSERDPRSRGAGQVSTLWEMIFRKNINIHFAWGARETHENAISFWICFLVNEKRPFPASRLGAKKVFSLIRLVNSGKISKYKAVFFKKFPKDYLHGIFVKCYQIRNGKKITRPFILIFFLNFLKIR